MEKLRRLFGFEVECDCAECRADRARSQELAPAGRMKVVLALEADLWVKEGTKVADLDGALALLKSRLSEVVQEWVETDAPGVEPRH